MTIEIILPLSELTDESIAKHTRNGFTAFGRTLLGQQVVVFRRVYG